MGADPRSSDQWTHGVVRVTTEGRGFVMDTGELRAGRVVITAAHCLPHIPMEFPIEDEERTYSNLLGSLGDDPTVWAQCLFVDPVADLAVLGSPDDQVLSSQSTEFYSWVEGLVPFRLGAIRDNRDTCWLLSLDGTWCQGSVRAMGHGYAPLWISGVEAGILGGMSGGPIVIADGSAIGVVTLAFGSSDFMMDARCPRLTHDLPGLLLRAITTERRRGSGT